MTGVLFHAGLRFRFWESRSGGDEVWRAHLRLSGERARGGGAVSDSWEWRKGRQRWPFAGHNWQSLRSRGTCVAAVPTHRSQVREAEADLTAVLASRLERQCLIKYFLHRK